MKIGTNRLPACLLFILLSIVVGRFSYAQTYLISSQGGVPFPYDPYDGAEPIVTLNASNGVYEVEDNADDWNLLTAAQELDASGRRTMSADSPDPTGGDGTDTNGSGGTYSPEYQPLVFGSNDLWIELKQLDIVNSNAYLTLHGTAEGESYQLLYTNTLSTNGKGWTLGEIIGGAGTTNQTDFSVFNYGTNLQMFFRGHHSDNEVFIQPGPNAVEPNSSTGDPGRIGVITVYLPSAITNDLTVQYTVSGTASAGIDYSNLPGVATIPAGARQTNIQVVPFENPMVDGAETVTLTIQQTNNFLIDPRQFSATILVEDSSTTVSVLSSHDDAVRPGGPSGEPAVVGDFQLLRDDERNLLPELTVYFTLGGTASNGVDYELLTNVVFPVNENNVPIDVTPLGETQLQGVKTVTLTLVPTNTYLVDTNN